jgi:hypothetical protein
MWRCMPLLSCSALLCSWGYGKICRQYQPSPSDQWTTTSDRVFIVDIFQRQQWMTFSMGCEKSLNLQTLTLILGCGRCAPNPNIDFGAAPPCTAHISPCSTTTILFDAPEFNIMTRINLKGNSERQEGEQVFIKRTFFYSPPLLDSLKTKLIFRYIEFL